MPPGWLDYFYKVVLNQSNDIKEKKVEANREKDKEGTRQKKRMKVYTKSWKEGKWKKARRKEVEKEEGRKII